jgi:hypothetical protein
LLALEESSRENVKSAIDKALVCLPQTERPVSSSIVVPIGNWSQPGLEPWALDDKVDERGRRHGGEMCGRMWIVVCGAVDEVDSFSLDAKLFAPTRISRDGIGQ